MTGTNRLLSILPVTSKIALNWGHQEVLPVVGMKTFEFSGPNPLSYASQSKALVASDACCKLKIANIRLKRITRNLEGERSSLEENVEEVNPLTYFCGFSIVLQSTKWEQG